MSTPPRDSTPRPGVVINDAEHPIDGASPQGSGGGGVVKEVGSEAGSARLGVVRRLGVSLSLCVVVRSVVCLGSCLGLRLMVMIP